MPTLNIGASQRLCGGTGRIEGVVQDKWTGAPINGTTVMIRPCSVMVGNTGYGPFSEWTPFFITANDGAFHVDGLPPGRFHIEARADGYLPHHHSPLQELFGRVGRSRAFDILRSSEHHSGWDEAWNDQGEAEPDLRNQFPRIVAGETRRINVALRPGRVIPGRVHDSKGNSIPGATVKLIDQTVRVERGCYGVNDLPSATTDSDGSFRLTVYTGFDADLLVSAPGFASQHVSVNPSQDNLDLALIPASTLRGRVTRADGRAALRTRVVVFNPADLETALTSEADETGAWSIDNVPPPPFAVLASHGYSGGCWMVVRESIQELNLVLRPLIAIRGQLVEPDGRPVEEQFIHQVFPFEWEGRIVTVDHPHRWDCGTIEKTDNEGRFLVRLAPDDSGVVLLKFDYYAEPASVDGRGEVRLVISDKLAESRAMSRKYAHLNPKEEPEPPAAGTPASCALPAASQPDLSPADFESRNRTWIGLLQSEPPAERVALLEKLREEISGGG